MARIPMHGARDRATVAAHERGHTADDAIGERISCQTGISGREAAGSDEAGSIREAGGEEAGGAEG
jgi:hypothetical protein